MLRLLGAKDALGCCGRVQAADMAFVDLIKGPGGEHIANAVTRKKVMREAKADRAHLIQAFKLGRGEFDV